MTSCNPVRLKALKGPVYALQDPGTQQYIALCGSQARLADLHLATIAPATPEGLACLELRASEKLAPYSIPHDLVRVDAAP